MKKSDAKISAINNPENREGKHPFQFWIAQLYLSVAPSTPAELFSNDHIQKGGKPLHREEDLKYMAYLSSSCS